MGPQFLIDTSAVIKFLNETFPSEGLRFLRGLQVFHFSFVTRIELLSWSSSDPDAYLDLQRFIDRSVVHGLNESIILETIRIRRDYRLKLPDAFIVAIALILNATLVADNDRDFLKIPGLSYLNPARLTI